MALLSAIGFGLNTNANEYDGSDLSLPGTIVTNPVLGRGVYAFRSPPGARSDGYTAFNSGTTNGIIYAKIDIYIAAAPTAETKIIQFFESGVASRLIVTINPDMTLKLHSGDPSNVQIGSASQALALSTRYRVEVSYNNNVGTGKAELELRLNGTTVASTTTSTDTGGINAFDWGNYDTGDATLDFYCMDAQVNDNTGGSQNSWPGECFFAYARPAGDGDNHSWQKSNGNAGDANNYNQVNETPPDDATTYLKRISTGIKTDDYIATAPSAMNIRSADNINFVAVGIRGGATSGTASTQRDVLTRVKSASGGTTSQSANSTNRMNINGWQTQCINQPRNYKLVSYTDPTTGVAWTVNGTNSLTNMQIGCATQVSSTTEVRMTALWALISVTPSPIATLLNVRQAINRSGSY